MITPEKMRTEIARKFFEHGFGNAKVCYEVLQILNKYAEQERTNTKLMLMEANINGYTEGLKDSSKAEPCDDVVSRQAVLDLAYDMSEIDGEHFSEPHMVVDVEDVQKLPPVTQKPETVTEFADRCRECGTKYGKLLKQKTGHWIWNVEKGYCKCSKCGIGMGHTEFDYCPNCGARMESKEEKE